MNVPKDVVNKNIKRAMDTDTANYDELTYEGYGHGGVGLIINVLSDNKNRAVEMVSTALKKEGCKVAASGSVQFNFNRKGRIAINSELDEEALLELAIEAGCEGDVELQPPDVEGRGDAEAVRCVALTESTELGLVQGALQEAGHECSAQLVNVPMTTVECNDEDEELNCARPPAPRPAQRASRLTACVTRLLAPADQVIDRLEEIDDVSSVEHNMAVPDAVAA